MFDWVGYWVSSGSTGAGGFTGCSSDRFTVAVSDRFPVAVIDPSCFAIGGAVKVDPGIGPGLSRTILEFKLSASG